ncbi:MAG: zf-HC2 domain-containing protein [Lachnospiraceae bacterium]|nr:zf-HC2 domain-containing protein [Lachnospiraceae bacterium]
MSKSNELTCKDYEKMINDYMGDLLNEDEVLDFLSHIENCPSCKEELTIQFMVSQGLNKLEENGTFDLNKELSEKINSSLKAIKVRNLVIFLSIAGFLSVIVAIAIFIFFSLS